MLKSYYEILGVDENASQKEIKAQFKKLAKMYHPDINSSVEAEKIFKTINAAANVLLDETKRKNYDALRFSTKTFNTSNKKPNKDFKKEEKTNAPIDGEDITINVTIGYMESLFGIFRTINIANTKVCPKCLGYKFANGSNCPICNGKGEINSTRKIKVKIPPHVKNGSKLRLKGEGGEGQFGGKNGNLYVVIEIVGNEELKIKDNTVYYTAEISPYTAILGGDIKVPTLWGETTIKIPPFTKSNQTFKLIETGILNEKTNKKGDEIVTIIIQIPKNITDEEYHLYEKLKEINLNKKNATI